MIAPDRLIQTDTACLENLPAFYGARHGAGHTATAYHPGGGERYSYLSASAGFARATSSACPETVRRAMSAASTLAAMKDVKATST